MTKILLGGIAALTFTTFPMFGTIIGSATSFGSGDNILFGSAQSGTTINGTLNGNGNVTAVFTDANGTFSTTGQGQAGINFLTPAQQNAMLITFNNFTPARVLINPSTTNASTVSTFNVVATDTAGTAFNFSYAASNGNGQNFFTLTALAGESIKSINVSGASGTTFSDLAQVRVDGPFTGPGQPPQGFVPEPATFGLIGLGITGLLARKRFAARS